MSFFSKIISGLLSRRVTPSHEQDCGPCSPPTQTVTPVPAFAGTGSGGVQGHEDDAAVLNPLDAGLRRHDDNGKHRRGLHHFSYLWPLFLANVKTHLAEPKKFAFMSLFMIIQNTMFFVIWPIFFTKVSSLNGWQLTDLVRMFGCTSSAIGLTLFFFNGIRTLPYRIMDTSLDMFLTRPRHPLPSLMLSGSSPASAGDVLYGPLMWILFGDVTAPEFLLLTLLTLLSAIICTSVVTIFYSSSFWFKGNARFPEQLFEMYIISTTNVLHGLPFGFKIVVFTVIPAGFSGFVPAMMLREFDWGLLAAMIAAALIYGWIAVRLFNAGLRRYIRA